MTAVSASWSPTVRSSWTDAWPQSPSVSIRNRHLDQAGLSVEVGPPNGGGAELVLKAAAAELSPLLRLQDGWDGAHARKVDERAAFWSMWVVADLVSDVVAMPQVFPLPDGGIQLEWLINGNGLEIDVAPSGELGVLGIDRNGVSRVDGEARAGAGFGALPEVRAYLKEIAKPLVG